MEDPNLLVQEQGLNFGSVVEAIIKRSCIIDYGIVQEVVSDGVVDVAVAVSRTKQDMICLTCVLANTASSSLTVNIKPNVGDRVLVVYPRIFNDKMFEVPENKDDEEDDKKKKKEVIVDFNAKGYNLMSGIAILINQYKEASHKNLITVEDGKVDMKLGYYEEDDEEKFHITFSTDEDGAVAFSNEKCNINIDKDGCLNAEFGYYEEDDEEKFHDTVTTDKDGAVTVSNDKASLEVSKDGDITVANEKGSVKMNKDGELTYSVDDKATVSVDKDGALAFSNKKSTFDIDKDGYLAYANTGDSNTKLEFTSSGMTIKDKNGLDIVTDGTYTMINGNLKVKK